MLECERLRQLHVPGASRDRRRAVLRIRQVHRDLRRAEEKADAVIPGAFLLEPDDQRLLLHVTVCFACSASSHTTTLQVPSADAAKAMSAVSVVTAISRKLSPMGYVFVSNWTTESFEKSHPSAAIVPAKRM